MSELDQLVRQVEALPPDQRRLLMNRLGEPSQPSLKGTRGIDLLPLAGRLDDVSAREMREAIEEGCERIDSDEW